MFISFLYMFRATVCPSSGETTVFMQHLVLVILHTGQSSTRNKKYQVSHKYSCFSWWWTHSRPKHVQKGKKHTKNFLNFISIVVPCIFNSVRVLLQTNALFIRHKMLKFTLKYYTVSPTCFGLLWPSSGSFSLNLAKVTLFCRSHQ
jgi:hypothetical protein